jgi:carboxyl-terminal processing protease
MNKKISVGVAISLIAIACTVTFVVTWTVSFNMYNDMIPVARRDEINAKIQEIDAFIQNNYLFLDQIDEERVNFEMFSGYISGIGDKNTVYMTAEEYTNRLNVEAGQLVTCGVTVEKEGSDYIKVTEVYPGSSAESYGVMRGDIITAIDGHDVISIGQDNAIRFLDGEENTRVELTVQREGTEVTHSLVRQAIDIVSVESAVVEGIGFVRVTAFSALTVARFDEALQSFVQEEIRAMVLDLRANSSDVYAPVQDMVNRLIAFDTAGTIAFTEHRGGIRRDFVTIDGNRVFEEDIPIVILTDSGTSGAGELMTAIMKSYAGANTYVVGAGTAGNAYLQQTHPLKDGSAIRVTVAGIILASELDYANTGLTPDYAVELTGEIGELADPNDLQVARAFEIIETITVNPNVNNFD